MSIEDESPGERRIHLCTSAARLRERCQARSVGEVAHKTEEATRRRVTHSHCLVFAKALLGQANMH